jgi:hypothetical protein
MALFDNIKVEPLECFTIPPLEEEPIYMGRDANRFIERYDQTINTNWEAMDPKPEWQVEARSDWNF